MCNYRDGGDVEDWDDDSDTDDHADDMGDDGHHEQGARDSDLDLDDEDRAFLSQFPDTWGAALTRKEKDIQGIKWERLDITREQYRQIRLQQYKNYENIPNSGEAAVEECKQTEKDGMYYEFRKKY